MLSFPHFKTFNNNTLRIMYRNRYINTMDHNKGLPIPVNKYVQKYDFDKAMESCRIFFRSQEVTFECLTTLFRALQTHLKSFEIDYEKYYIRKVDRAEQASASSRRSSDSSSSGDSLISDTEDPDDIKSIQEYIVKAEDDALKSTLLKREDKVRLNSILKRLFTYYKRLDAVTLFMDLIFCTEKIGVTVPLSDLRLGLIQIQADTINVDKIKQSLEFESDVEYIRDAPVPIFAEQDAFSRAEEATGSDTLHESELSTTVSFSERIPENIPEGDDESGARCSSVKKRSAEALSDDGDETNDVKKAKST